MATANIQSSRVTDLQIVTSMLVNESNNAETNATDETPGSGLFLSPSTVAGRLADITGFLVTGENELGKLEFTDPDGFLSLEDLSDVDLTAPATNDLLAYNGTVWVNVDDIIVDSATVVKGTATMATYAAAAPTINAAAGTVTVTNGNVGLATRSTAVVVTNSTVTATSVVTLQVERAGNGEPYAMLTAIAAGSFTFVVYSPITALDDGSAIDIHFVVL